jgi:hypothetical protein
MADTWHQGFNSPYGSIGKLENTKESKKTGFPLLTKERIADII